MRKLIIYTVVAGVTMLAACAPRVATTSLPKDEVALPEVQVITETQLLEEPIPTLSTLPDNRGLQDDLMFIPTGLTYRNGRDPSVMGTWIWIEPETITVGLTIDENSIETRYRALIQTVAGEFRNNIITVMPIYPYSHDHTLELYLKNAPASLAFHQVQNIQIHFPVSATSLLVIDISPEIQPGEYSFEIGIVADSVDYGTVPCVVSVR